MAQSTYECNKITKFKHLLDTHHVSPQIWDDAFAEKVTRQIFKNIDPQAVYFNKDEIQLFVANSKNLDDNLLKGYCSIITELSPIYVKALDRAQRLIKELKNTPLDLTVKDTLTYNLSGGTFLTTDLALRNRWAQVVKLSVLKDLETNNEEDLNKLKPTIKILADKAYNKYLNLITRRKEVAGGIELYLFNKLINAIARVYDPHTEFYPASDKQSFLDMLSTDNYSFGFILDDDHLGNIIISRVIPGSSAWEVKNIHVGDRLVSISSPHMEKIDAALYTSEEVEEILETISREIELSVQKIDGQQIKVKLIKQRVREDDNKIKSFVITDKESRFGYINLPIFFSKNEITKTGCAIELAKEIIHLKSAKIQGLILDLRNNGGGDLSEAIDLSGIFIDRGALAITKRSNYEAETLKDTNLGTAYDGPLIVMINRASASASELFAAAMRDHNRGILVGGSTFGKATGQSVMFFDETHREMTKITSLRFYSIKGTSHQGHGITPDIPLPDMIDDVEYDEASQNYALAPDQIQKKTYYTPLAPLPIDLLRDSSSHRIANSPFFQEIEVRKENLAPYRHGLEYKLPLTMAGFHEMNSRVKSKIQNAKPVSDHWSIKLTNFDQHVTGVDNFGQETLNNLMENISQDFYIAEVLHILKNYTQIKK